MAREAAPHSTFSIWRTVGVRTRPEAGAAGPGWVSVDFTRIPQDRDQIRDWGRGFQNAFKPAIQLLSDDTTATARLIAVI
jgi:hypothetical protein